MKFAVGRSNDAAVDHPSKDIMGGWYERDLIVL